MLPQGYPYVIGHVDVGLPTSGGTRSSLRYAGAPCDVGEGGAKMNQTWKYLLVIALFLYFLPSNACAENNILTFRLVHPDNDKVAQMSPTQLKNNKKQYEHFVKDNVSYWVDRKIQLSSKEIKDVKIVMMEQEPNLGNWKTVEVSLKKIVNNKKLTDPSMQGFTAVIIINKKGQKKLERLTEKNIGRRLAIVLKDKLLMAPVIQDKIIGNEVSVAGLSYIEVKSLEETIRR